MGYAQYVASPSARRTALVRRMQATQGTEYNPARDFYRGLRKAITDGRRSGRDSQSVTAAAENAHTKKQSSYRRLGTAWLDLLEGELAESTWTEAPTLRWVQAGLAVKVTPILGLTYPDGRQELVLIHFALERPHRDVVRAALRVAQLAAQASGSAAEPILVDLQQRTVHRPVLSDADYDAQLAAEAAGLSYLISNLAA